MGCIPHPAGPALRETFPGDPMLRCLLSLLCVLVGAATIPAQVQKKTPQTLTTEDVRRQVLAYLQDEGKEQAATLSRLVELDVKTLTYRQAPPDLFVVVWEVRSPRRDWPAAEKTPVEQSLRTVLVQALGQYKGGLLSRDFTRLQFLVQIEPAVTAVTPPAERPQPKGPRLVQGYLRVPVLIGPGFIGVMRVPVTLLVQDPADHPLLQPWYLDDDGRPLAQPSPPPPSVQVAAILPVAAPADKLAPVERLVRGRTFVDAPQLFTLGQARYWRGEPEEALDYLEAAIRLDREDARSWYFKGLVELALGRQAAARQSFARAVELHAQDKPGRDEIALALERVQGPVRIMLRRLLEEKELGR